MNPQLHYYSFKNLPPKAKKLMSIFGFVFFILTSILSQSIDTLVYKKLDFEEYSVVLKDHIYTYCECYTDSLKTQRSYNFDDHNYCEVFLEERIEEKSEDPFTNEIHYSNSSSFKFLISKYFKHENNSWLQFVYSLSGEEIQVVKLEFNRIEVKEEGLSEDLLSGKISYFRKKIYYFE